MEKGSVIWLLKIKMKGKNWRNDDVLKEQALCETIDTGPINHQELLLKFKAPR